MFHESMALMRPDSSGLPSLNFALPVSSEMRSPFRPRQISRRIQPVGPKKGGGRVAAVEVMVNTARIADLIRDGETDKIIEAIEDGEFHKMQSFSQHLVQLVLADQVEEEVASNAASNRHDFDMAVQQALKRRRADEKAAAAAKAEAEEPEADEPEAVSNGNGAGLRVASTEK